VYNVTFFLKQTGVKRVAQFFKWLFHYFGVWQPYSFNDDFILQERFEEHPQPAWVSVYDQLPPLNTEVLVRHESGKVRVMRLYNGIKQGIQFEDENGMWQLTSENTHWFPIPEFN